MVAIISWGLIWTFLLSLLASSFSNFPSYDVSPGPIGLASLLLLWVLMLIHFFRNRELKRKVWWGVLLFLFPWLGGVIYFLRTYHPQNKVNAIENIKAANPTFYKFAMAICVCAGMTILHQFFFSNFYSTFGIPFPEAYSLIVNKIIYFPVYILLTTIYNNFNVDLSGEPSQMIAVLAHTTNLLYTMGLYLVAYYSLIRLKRIKSG